MQDWSVSGFNTNIVSAYEQITVLNAICNMFK